VNQKVCDMVALISAKSFLYIYMYIYFYFLKNLLAPGKPSLSNFYGHRVIVIYVGFVDRIFSTIYLWTSNSFF